MGATEAGGFLDEGWDGPDAEATDESAGLAECAAPAFASQARAEGFSALHSASSWRNSTSKIYRRDAILGMIAELEFAC